MAWISQTVWSVKRQHENPSRWVWDLLHKENKVINNTLK
jgi:hypothetical protein